MCGLIRHFNRRVNTESIHPHFYANLNVFVISWNHPSPRYSWRTIAKNEYLRHNILSSNGRHTFVDAGSNPARMILYSILLWHQDGIKIIFSLRIKRIMCSSHFITFSIPSFLFIHPYTNRKNLEHVPRKPGLGFAGFQLICECVRFLTWYMCGSPI